MDDPPTVGPGPRILGAAVCMLGTVVLVGWGYDVDLLKGALQPGWASMKPNTALGFVLSGLALVLLGTPCPERWRLVGGRILAAAALLVAIATLLEYGVGIGWIDQLFFRDPYGPPQAPPGRPSLPTAVSFAFSNAALIALHAKRRPTPDLAEIGPMVVAAIAMFAALGYLYGVPMAAALGGTVSMALHTAFGFALLSAGILLTRPDRGLVGLLSSPGAGGHVLRRLLPVAFLAPAALGWLRLEGELEGAYTTEFGITIMVTAMTVLFTTAVTWGARSAAEAERVASDAADILERRVQQRTAELAAANRDLQAFVQAVAHDLRAPLRWLDGYAQALAEDYSARLDAQGITYIDRIREGAQRLGRTLDDLLRLSQATRAELRMEPVDLVPIVHAVEQELRRADPERDVVLEVPALLPTRGDARLLRLLLANVIGNAWKFTRGRSPARIVVTCETGPGGTVFAVADNGVGFDMAHAQQLFEPFCRLHDSDRFEGTGIGLAIAHQIVERHGGHLWAEAVPDEGATIRFTLGG